MKFLALGARAVSLRPRLLAAAWLLQAAFAALACGPAAGVFLGSLAHRPAASHAFLDGFSLEMLVDWGAAYGGPLAAHFRAALALSVLYAAATVMLEAALLPAYLEPFERFEKGRLGRAAMQALPGLIAVALGGLILWTVLLGVFLLAHAALDRLADAMQSEVWPTLLALALAAGALSAAAVMRLLLNLWKCARVSGAGGLGTALAAAARRPLAMVQLAGATLAALALYAVVAGAVLLYAMAAPHVVLGIALEQLMILAAVALRLWLLASSTVFWRRLGGQTFLSVRDRQEFLSH